MDLFTTNSFDNYVLMVNPSLLPSSEDTKFESVMKIDEDDADDDGSMLLICLAS